MYAMVGGIGGGIVVTYQRHVQYHLYKMFFGAARCLEVVIREGPLARLLLHQHAEVLLQVVHTPLQAQHLRKERRLNDAVPAVKVGQGLWQRHLQRLYNVVLLPLRLLVKSCSPLNVQQTDSMVFEESLHCVGVWASVRQMVNDIVEQLSGHITQYDSLRRLLRLQFLYQLHCRRVGIVGKAMCHGRDIDQIVGLEDYQLRIDHTIVPARTDQVQLCVTPEQLLQVSPVEVVVLVAMGIAHRLQFAVGRIFSLHINKLIVPLLNDDTHALTGKDRSKSRCFFHWKQCCQLLGNVGAIDKSDETAKVFQVVKTELLQVGSRCLVAFAEPYAGVVSRFHQSGGGFVLLQQIVGLGKVTTEVYLCLGGQLVQTFLERQAHGMINLPIIGSLSDGFCQLVKEIGSCLGVESLVLKSRKL